MPDSAAILGQRMQDAQAALDSGQREQGIRMLARWGIDCALLAARGDIPDVLVHRTAWSPDPQGRERRGILVEVAEEMGVAALSRRVSERITGADGLEHASAGCELIGWESDVHRTMVLWRHLVSEVERELREYPRPEGVNRGKHARDTAKAMAVMARDRVSAAEKFMRLSATRASAARRDFPDIAPVLRQRQADVAAELERLYPGLGKALAPGRGSCIALAA